MANSCIHGHVQITDRCAQKLAVEEGVVTCLHRGPARWRTCAVLTCQKTSRHRPPENDNRAVPTHGLHSSLLLPCSTLVMYSFIPFPEHLQHQPTTPTCIPALQFITVPTFLAVFSPR
ncbi:uncharacterized protein LOC143281146 [Babylonia areolata]|uniref:uncharacterized protein LOC143281146 n=1 Tax=Babylonia areolata TaxID=304850 RepID=UPI003FD1971E